ncbi:MAG: DUF1007 family protein, partial [Campylobacterota bacterium]|nr:DUF1007 family protein [Campylobacterota bacterium]
MYPTINVKDNKTTKINFKWKMDDMTSSMLIMEFDKNGDAKIDKKENFFIYTNYFLTLKDYNFYTDIKIKDKIQTFPKPKNFKASIDKYIVSYSFDIEENYNIKDLKIDF